MGAHSSLRLAHTLNFPGFRRAITMRRTQSLELSVRIIPNFRRRVAAIRKTRDATKAMRLLPREGQNRSSITYCAERAKILREKSLCVSGYSTVRGYFVWLYTLGVPDEGVRHDFAKLVNGAPIYAPRTRERLHLRAEGGRAGGQGYLSARNAVASATARSVSAERHHPCMYEYDVSSQAEMPKRGMSPNTFVS